MTLVKRRISYTRRPASEQPNFCAGGDLKAVTPGATAFRIEKAPRQAMRQACVDGED